MDKKNKKKTSFPKSKLLFKTAKEFDAFLAEVNESLRKNHKPDSEDDRRRLESALHFRHDF